jgi:hypothetical protein
MTQENHQIRNRILQGAFIGLIFLAIVFILYWPDSIYPWIGLAVAIALEAGRSAVRKAALPGKDREKDSTYKFFFYGIRVVIIIMLVVGVLGTYALYRNNSSCASCTTYQIIGMAMVILWSCVFLGYFIWAIYFYNINYGITEDEWEKIKEEKRKKNTGQFYAQGVLDEEPVYNPYENETFGLPPGTVRGMIAFTLLFGGLAMLIVSIGFKNEMEEGTVFHDHYEFFKTAFTMMIAFYFGSRALDALKGNTTPDGRKGRNIRSVVTEFTSSSENTPESANSEETTTQPAHAKVQLPVKDTTTGETVEMKDPMD